ncbi:pyridoxamine 5'-phosphate oxidase-related FMN- binding protein [Kribbella flavida DSM 17836]|uniref:Pyridoxamine 5'-phosphate oxidase-related FMN-binding protein n=1 Tax=Kribbella flavida (strain DSM 17836 / JCM 10339 / NBRC 14399) TaxID=479435 RepID=D2Q3B8_KRIFD|nr:pyridoxamine 5'-phosphate oxidase family protein [Kribbella flavida]ADB34041.1 pyridoxamine 5'-phosphate oxidase-related FMN- binding protein [Kribbella flavida DSM 17836]
MNQHEIAEILAKPYSQQLLNGRIPARFAYVGLDGDPRVVPLGFHFDGERLQLFTVPKAAKVNALRKNPRVAITIDTEGFPPKVLLIRGTTELRLEDGVPADYLASGKLVPADEFDAWKAGVEALYDQMVRITVTPDWVKLLDFETTLPKSVADLIAEKQGG